MLYKKPLKLCNAPLNIKYYCDKVQIFRKNKNSEKIRFIEPKAH